jgi:hypothetical protein
MTANEQIEKQAKHIADAIVDLVERTDGPVTFTQIEREVEGFATNERSSWAYELGERPGQPVALIWDGMSEAGAAALRQAMCERRVAIQIVTPDLYFDRFPEDEKWTPLVLLPVRAANLDGFRWHMRAPEAYLDPTDPFFPFLKKNYRFLTPGPVRSTADRFSPPKGDMSVLDCPNNGSPLT